jgi:hypothetical protein
MGGSFVLKAWRALQNEPLAPLMKIRISPQFGQQQREVSPGGSFGASVLTVGLTGVVMPARSGARLAGFRSYTVCLAYHRRPRTCVRRGCLVLAHNSTPDAVWRPGQERRQRWHTGRAEPAHNACDHTSNIWTASEPLCGPLSGSLAVHRLAELTIQRSRSSHARAMATSAEDGAGRDGRTRRILGSHDQAIQGCASAALARVQAAAGSQLWPEKSPMVKINIHCATIACDTPTLEAQPRNATAERTSPEPRACWWRTWRTQRYTPAHRTSAYYYRAYRPERQPRHHHRPQTAARSRSDTGQTAVRSAHALTTCITKGALNFKI